MTLVTVEEVVKKYGDTTILNGINLSIEQGEVVAVIGPSGAGKSTLLSCLNGLEKVTSGRITISGAVITALSDKEMTLARKKIGMVFQHFNLFRNLTAKENITMPLSCVLGYSKEKGEEIARAMLDRVGLLDKINSYPDQLSGGQKQRVAIARTLSMDPDVILFDEPTSALDPEMVAEVTGIIEKLAQQKMTMLISSHEMGFVRRIADRVMFVDEGIVFEQGEAKEFFSSPKNERTRQFLSKILSSV